MEFSFGINATLGDLDLVSASIDAEDRLIKAYDIFAKHPTYPGLIVSKDGNFFRMLSKANFFEVMSQQFMFDMYSCRSANYFFDENEISYSLMLDANTSVLKASTIALQRPSNSRFDPIIVKFSDACFKLLDYYVLLMAEIQLHIQTSILLHEANELKKDVLEMVAHDLRNPISAIWGFANVLVQSTKNDQNISEYAKIILETSQQMQNMVDDLLVSAINDATDFSVNPSPFDLVRLINQIIANFKEHSELKNQKILFFYSNNSIRINADATKLREVMENLISNAIKYSEAGKEIKIYVDELEQKIIIKVTDEGPGMNDIDKKKVFGKFTRLSAKPTAGESSTGLGLFIVKKLVELHGGIIWVESELNEGSTFVVEVPHNMKETEKRSVYI